MTKLAPLAIVGGALALALLAKISAAAPLGQPADHGLNAATATLSVVEQAHGTHRACRRGPVARWGGAVRWHRHVGVAHTPVRC